MAPKRQRLSIWARKADLLYLVFFAVHIPVMLSVDLVPFIPAALRPGYMGRIRGWYIETYKDRFFTDAAPAWFSAYLWLELVYHLPLSIWAIGALLRDDPLAPLHLLVWACETAVTTMTYGVEAWSWEELTRREKWDMMALWMPYFVLACVMLIDMFMRLRAQILAQTPAQLAKGGYEATLANPEFLSTLPSKSLVAKDRVPVLEPATPPPQPATVARRTRHR